MASVLDVPALRGPPDITNALQMISEGLELRQKHRAEREKNALAQAIGSKVAGGDYAGAEGAAFAAGDINTGLKVHELSLADKKQFAETVQRYTMLADTPEKWDAVRQKLTETTGEDPGDFETGRTGLLSEFGDLDKILQANNQTADNTRADESLGIQKEELAIKKAEASSGGKSPPGYEKAADGTLKPIPGGPADPTTITAQSTARSAGTATKPNERQQRNAQLYKVVTPEVKIVDDNFKSLTSILNQTGANSGPFKNALVSTGYQRARNSVRTIVASYLYSVSGATANPGEVETQTDILMPKFGDGKDSVADKLARIHTMVDSMKDSGDFTAGPADPAADDNTPLPGFSQEEWDALTPEERKSIR